MVGEKDQKALRRLFGNFFYKGSLRGRAAMVFRSDQARGGPAINNAVVSGGCIPSGRPGGLVVGVKDQKALVCLKGIFSTREALEGGTVMVFQSDPG